MTQTDPFDPALDPDPVRDPDLEPVPYEPPEPLPQGEDPDLGPEE
jgi:hypothetical protein